MTQHALHLRVGVGTLLLGGAGALALLVLISGHTRTDTIPLAKRVPVQVLNENDAPIPGAVVALQVHDHRSAFIQDPVDAVEAIHARGAMRAYVEIDRATTSLDGRAALHWSGPLQQGRVQLVSPAYLRGLTVRVSNPSPKVLTSRSHAVTLRVARGPQRAIRVLDEHGKGIFCAPRCDRPGLIRAANRCGSRPTLRGRGRSPVSCPRPSQWMPTSTRRRGYANASPRPRARKRMLSASRRLPGLGCTGPCAISRGTRSRAPPCLHESRHRRVNDSPGVRTCCWRTRTARGATPSTAAPAGTIDTIVAAARGHMTRWRIARNRRLPADRPVEVDIQLPRAVPIHGVVTDEAGSPLEGIAIAPLMPFQHHDKHRPLAPRMVFTDAQGRFTMLGIPKRAYLLEVAHWHCPAADGVRYLETDNDGPHGRARHIDNPAPHSGAMAYPAPPGCGRQPHRRPRTRRPGPRSAPGQ